MTSTSSTLLRVTLCSLLGAACAASLRAQAPAGPINPPRSADNSSSAPPRLNPRAQPPPPPADRPAPRANIAGAWRLNRDQSDDARKKIGEVERSTSRNGTWGGGGNGPYGGGPMGGGPFPGSGGGPYGGGNRGPGRGEERDDEARGLREYTSPAFNLNFVIKDTQTELTDESGRKLVFCTDGRKLQKSKNENYREIAAHWEGSRLVAKDKSPQGGEIRRSFELSGDGRSIDEFVTLEVGRSRRSVMLHYVYDAAQDKG